MNTTKYGLLGVQLTLVGLYLVTYFDGVGSLPLAGLVLGAVGVGVTVLAVANSP